MLVNVWVTQTKAQNRPDIRYNKGHDKMKDEQELIKQIEHDLDMVFENVKLKVINRRNKKGNTALPWVDFTTEHLSKRLDEEWEEWKESNDPTELIDIIAMAAFLNLSVFYDLLEDM